MRTSMTFASLLLLLLATTTHGIRLDRQLQEAIEEQQKVVYPTSSGKASVARSVNKPCSTDDGDCSSGPTKKMHAESGAATRHMQISTGHGHATAAIDADATTKSSQAVRHDDEAEAADAATPWQRQAFLDDIAGMDYSPATRRSPIHN